LYSAKYFSTQEKCALKTLVASLNKRWGDAEHTSVYAYLHRMVIVTSGLAGRRSLVLISIETSNTIDL